MGNKTKFGDTHLSKPYQNGQFCNFIDDAIVSRPSAAKMFKKYQIHVVTSQLDQVSP